MVLGPCGAVPNKAGTGGQFDGCSLVSAVVSRCRQFDSSRGTDYAWSVPAPNRRQPSVSADISVASSRPATAALRDLGTLTFFRARDAVDRGVDSRALRRLVDEGAVERLGRGLYRRADAEITEHHTHGAVSARVPGAIICLLTALHIHDIGTQLPAQVWIAIPHKARTPRVPSLPIRIVRFSGAALRYGVEDADFEGVAGRITSPARTIVDCFRLRRLVGLDVALEAIRDALIDRKTTPSEILRAAEACRALSLVRPVLDTLLA